MSEQITYSYEDQPCNDVAYRLGKACRQAANDDACGDYIDRGLILLRELQESGFGVVVLKDR